MTLEEWVDAVGDDGPSCGWLMAYLEAMMAHYHIPLRELWTSFPVVVGFALLEAHNERHGAKGINWMDQAALAAMGQARQDLLRTHDLVE